MIAGGTATDRPPVRRWTQPSPSSSPSRRSPVTPPLRPAVPVTPECLCTGLHGHVLISRIRSSAE